MFKSRKNKISKSSVSGLQILVVLTLGLITLMPSTAGATVYCYNDGDSCYDTKNHIHGTSYVTDYTNPAPYIDAVSPSAGSSINGNIVVTISGSNFIPDSLVRWDNYYKSATFYSPNKLSITLNPSDSEIVGNHVITVFNPAPRGGTSNGVFFNVTTNIPTNVTSVNQRTTTSLPRNTTGQAGTNTATDNTGAGYSSLASNAIFGANGFMPSGLIQWLFFGILILLIIILIRKFYGPEKKFHSTPLKHS